MEKLIMTEEYILPSINTFANQEEEDIDSSTLLVTQLRNEIEHNKRSNLRSLMDNISKKKAIDSFINYITLAYKDYNLDFIRSWDNIVIKIIKNFILHPQVDISTFVGMNYKYFLVEELDISLSLDNRSEEDINKILLRNKTIVQLACQEAYKFIDHLLKVKWLTYNPNTRIYHFMIDISKDDRNIVMNAFYPLPFLVKPRKLTKNYHTGYYTEYLEKGSVILNKQYHDEDIVLSHLNRQNKIKYRFNIDIATRIKNNWKGINISDKEKSKKAQEFKQLMNAFNKYNLDTYKIISGLDTQLDNFKYPFYLTNKYDSRGRCYSQGYHINPQGNDWNKASIQFHKGQKLDSIGLKWLKIDIANNYGLNNKDYEDRIQWFDSIEKDIHNSDKMNNLMYKADSPACFISGIEAYKDYLKGNKVHHPIRLDATASGMQINSTVTGCLIGMRLTNVLSETRMNPYKIIFNELKKIIPSLKVEYERAKKCIMTTLYGSRATPVSIFPDSNERNAYYRSLMTNIPGAYNLDQFIQANWNSNVVWNRWILPDGFHVNIPIINKFTFRYGNNDSSIIELHSNSNFGRSLSPNITHSIDGMIVREICSRCSYNKDHKNYFNKISLENGKSLSRDKDKKLLELLTYARESNFYSVRLLEYIDEYNIGFVPIKEYLSLVNSLPDYSFDIMTNHDCFSILPNYGDELQKQYNHVLGQLYIMDINFILRQAIGKEFKCYNKDPEIVRFIHQAKYAIT